ncbi:MAG: zf-HC2 domain-containing protein [Deltaproteobacteria bacterium]|jgi:anti-sigma factor RsiW|nr:zf-HC2 domain-containing protein [Deltaproteobacteria bacterium]MBW2536250.1 zf-HC2 domain-containing protein [Deltaproteobacteria bacterium]
MSAPQSHQRYEELLMKAVDGLLAPAERRELDEHLEQCPDCAAELSDFTAIKETTDAMTERILADASIEPIRPSASAGAVLSLGFVLLLLGGLLLTGYAAFALFVDPAVPLTVKLGTGAMGLGTLVLAAYVLRVRLRARGRDPYEEIDR